MYFILSISMFSARINVYFIATQFLMLREFHGCTIWKSHSKWILIHEWIIPRQRHVRKRRELNSFWWEISTSILSMLNVPYIGQVLQPAFALGMRTVTDVSQHYTTLYCGNSQVFGAPAGAVGPVAVYFGKICVKIDFTKFCLTCNRSNFWLTAVII